MHTLTLPPTAPRAAAAQPPAPNRAPPPPPAPARLHAGPPAGWLPPRRRPGRLLAVLGAHLLLAGLLLQTDTVRQVLNAPPPVVVALIGDPSPPQPPAPLELPRPRLPLPAPMPLPAPEISIAAAPPAPPPAPVAVAAATPPVPPAPAAPAPAPVAVVAPAPVAPVAAPPAAPKAMPASAVRYRVPPPVEVPMASRRLGEQGTVLLQVWVDAQGLPRQVTLHRSSGFARLDEQALAAMRQARFQPVLDGGQAIEWVVIAPLQYELD